jgi:hypothetical protein
MNIRSLVIYIISLALASSAWANDNKDFVAEGYRWVAVDGPFACPTEQEVKQVTSDPTDAIELHMVADSGAYYLIPGTLAQIVKDDSAKGMSEILLAGVTKPLWTYTRFLCTSPIRDTYGVIETPQTSGLIYPGDAGDIKVPSAGSTSMPTAYESSAELHN